MANPKNATTTNRGRTYKWRDEEFTSVTTILNGGIPKPALKAWGEKLVAQTAVAKRDVWDGMTNDEAIDWLKRAPFRETDRAAVQGTDIHDWCEKYVLGAGLAVEDLAADDPKRGYLDGFLSFLAEWKPRFEMTEATVYNRRWGYAGTLDFLAYLDINHLVGQECLPGWLNGDVPDGEALVLGDYKTGKGVYGEVACQLSAYRHAEFIGLPDGTEHPMPQVAACVVLHLTPKGYELIPVRAGEVELRSFLYAQQIREFDQVIAKNVLGAPLPSRGSLVPPRPTPPPNISALVGEA